MNLLHEEERLNSVCGYTKNSTNVGRGEGSPLQTPENDLIQKYERTGEAAHKRDS